MLPRALRWRWRQDGSTGAWRRVAVSKPPISQRQLTTNSTGHGVSGAAISPDGRYLAYSDDVGVHIKLVETEGMRTIPLPAEAASGHAAWFPAAWFPKGTHLLADLDIAGKPPSVRVLSLVGEAPRQFRDNAWGHSISARRLDDRVYRRAQRSGRRLVGRTERMPGKLRLATRGQGPLRWLGRPTAGDLPTAAVTSG